MPLNRELFLKIKAHILEEPKRFNMSNWILDKKESREEHFRSLVKIENEPPCGTVCCLAGWSYVLRTGDKSPYNFDATKEAEFLGLKIDDDEEDTSLIFFVQNWPNVYQINYYAIDTPQNHAQVTADFIGYILEHEEEFAA